MLPPDLLGEVVSPLFPFPNQQTSALDRAAWMRARVSQAVKAAEERIWISLDPNTAHSSGKLSPPCLLASDTMASLLLAQEVTPPEVPPEGEVKEKIASPLKQHRNLPMHTMGLFF